MSFHTIPDTTIEYGLLAFDEDGRERNDDIAGGTFSRTLLERIERDKPTNIFLFSHGWKGDAEAAIDQYNRWIKAMTDLPRRCPAHGQRFQADVDWPPLAEPVHGAKSHPAASTLARARRSTR